MCNRSNLLNRKSTLQDYQTQDGFTYAKCFEVRWLSASERVARLTPSHKGMISLLAKGFRGELVGQEEE